MSAGIHENVELTHHELEKTENGSRYLLKFEGNGQETTIRLFPVNEEMAAKYPIDIKENGVKRKETAQEAIERNYKNFNTTMLHIGHRFVSREKLESDTKGATGFDDFITKFIDSIGDNYKGVKLRLKLVYNNKGYTMFPRFISNGGFIQRMDETPAITLSDYEKGLVVKPELNSDSSEVVVGEEQNDSSDLF